MNNFYVYLYLNPLKPSTYKTSFGDYKYEPIYVGKGTGSRIYHHITPKMLEINNHRYNLFNKIINKIGKGAYKKSYIVKVKDNLTNDEALDLEYDIMHELGTRYDIHPQIKRGPLLNFTLCGVPNPILYGENNPMYGISIYDKWESQYSPEIFNKMVKEHRKLLKTNAKIFWSNLNNNNDDYETYCKKVKKGVHKYWNSLSKSERSRISKQRSDNAKRFFGEYGSYENYYIVKYGLDNGLKKECERRDNIKEALKSFWANANESFKDEHSKKTKKGVHKFLKKYGNLDNYIISKFGNDYYNKWKANTRVALSKATQDRWDNTSAADREKHSNKLKHAWDNKTEEELLQHRKKYIGKNNPMYNNGHKVSGAKNGRATQWIIHMPNGERYYCDGNFKKFCKEKLRDIKPQPHRKYLKQITENDKPLNGWYFKKVDRSFNKLNYKIYE